MKIVVALFLAFGASSFAQPVPPTSTGPVAYPISTVRNVSTVGASSVSAGNVGRYAFAVATGGLVVADAATGVPLPDGKNLPVAVRSSIPKATVAAALGRFARKAIPLLGTGAALYDLGQELGFGMDNSSGVVSLTKPDTSLCTVAPCFEYTYSSTLYPYVRSPAQACVTGFAHVQGSSTTTVYTFTGFVAPDVCQGTRKIGAAAPTYSAINVTRRSASVQPPANAPATIQEFEDAIEAKTTWPPSSALARAMKDAINAGELTPIHPYDVTGPVTTPGPVTTSTDNVNNTTTTSTTTNNHTYSGPSVTTTTTTTNVTVDNSTGSVISSTTVNSQPVMPEQSEEDQGVASDTALPSIPKLYEPEFPDGLEGVWNDRKAQLLDTSLFQIIPTLMPNVGDGGCPTWSIPSIYGGNLNASIPCNVWYFIRLVIILTALMLARRLIFGG